ncbi:DUF302 domain-containing protein [Autumnicola musiva]|uniref:DUF302 domain-containing protein n=1 Tax=Autumnicola musiva TaxID=3075589 RepID=A0ABU3D7X3_9FLAO|nr:DUF302 domain-containing protein [Zunongwangia sp. F117]MDT0677103.1 DUF302 domain-containing protein [Zunongwangia sp. F117]
MKKIFFILFLIILMSCVNDEPGDVVFSSNVVQITGTRYSASNVDFENTYSGFITALNEEDSLEVFLEIDHAANAIATGRVLDATSLVFFRNPEISNLLLRENQLAGLDLPQKMLFFQNENSEVFAVYNAVAYLASRYGIEQAGNLQNSATVLNDLSTNATMAEIRSSADLVVEPEQGIITKDSPHTFAETYAEVRNNINSRENLEFLAEIDFQADAEYQTEGNEENEETGLKPTRLIIFGMPDLGTALMQGSQTLALDFPQKILVWEDEEGIVRISYNDPAFLAERHNLTTNPEELEQIITILDEISGIASAN